MSGIIRRIVIYVTVEGIILHGHSRDQHRSLCIEYGSGKITEISKGHDSHAEHTGRLDTFGLIGFLNIANSSYLIAITKREEVAKLFGKSVYLVKDVTLIPLSTIQDATKCIRDFESAYEAQEDSGASSSDEETGRSEKRVSSDLGTTPGDDVKPLSGNNRSSTSIAENVATRNVTFGNFASQWLTRQKSSTTTKAKDDTNNSISEPKPASGDDHIVDDIKQARKLKENSNANAATEQRMTQYAATTGLLPRILRTTKMLFTSGSYFYSYDFDLTHSLANLNLTKNKQVEIRELDNRYFWNRILGNQLIENGFETFLTPVIQGFVGQRTFTLSKIPGTGQDKLEGDSRTEPGTGESKQDFLLTLMSRRSTKRSGLRYLRRGIDDEGYVANFAETEQILSAADWASHVPVRSFLQIRGSIPLYYSQSPYSFKPAVVFQNSPLANEKAYTKHFQMLKTHYGAIQIAVLVDRHGNEKSIGESYEKLYRKSEENGQAENVNFEWFDFHAECRGMKFENVSRLVTKFEDFLSASSESVIIDGKLVARQKGVVRTNCMDCLDRTNVAQSAFAQQHLQRSLEAEGYKIDFVRDASTNWFNILWADNGDAISRLYASTAALKGDYTRTRRRNWRGAMNDFGLTISRYYSNMVNDYFSQTVIDVLLGNVSWKVFEDFETTMMSADPGISVRSGREAAIDSCSKIAIQDPDKEDLLHAWTMLVPNQENTMRTLPMEEAVVLLTDTALYCCRMDWSTEKVARYEKVDLRSIRMIKAGVYITSTFTERQMDEAWNQGVVLHYTPGKGDVIRVNTRSLQNLGVPDNEGGQRIDGGTGLLSWAASSVSRQPAVQERIIALKIVPPHGSDEIENLKAGQAKEIAETIADEIRRAITGSTEHGEQRGKALVDHSDIIGVAEAKKRTGYIEQVSHSLKRLVWA